MSEELEVLHLVGQRLDRAGMPYMVTGSIAVNYYAVPQLSGGLLSRSGHVRRTIEERGMFNLIHRAYVINVDFVVRKDSDYRREEFSRRRRVSVEGRDLFIAAPEDLILSKLEWARMSDTPLETERAFRELLLGRSGEERLKMGCSMHAFAQTIVRASVLERRPHASLLEVRRALFLRFYGRDFDPTTREKILLALGKAAEEKAETSPHKT